MLTQDYDVRVFHGKYGVLEIRLWRDGRCAGVFRNRISREEMRIDLIVDGLVNDEKIVSLLRLVNGAETDMDIQIIANAIWNLSHNNVRVRGEA